MLEGVVGGVMLTVFLQIMLFRLSGFLFCPWASSLRDGHPGSVPSELVNDGDFLLLPHGMLHLRGLDTVRNTKVKGHADEAMGS